MTSFLSRILDDAECGSRNQETQRLFAYHQATKHTYQSVRAGAHFLDWANQPDPFRTYQGAPTILLPQSPDGFPVTGTFAAMAGLAGGARFPTGNPSCSSEPTRLDARWLSRLLWHSMAVSAWKKVPGSGNRYSLRVNPSSGNLHPTETYCAVRGFADLDDGLYHYRADRHALELRLAGAQTQEIAEALQIPRAAESSPLIVGFTSIFWREAWKYRNRAYRYCCHDLGHAMMSVLLAARVLGLPGGAITHFADARLTRVLGLTGSDEAPMIFLVFPSNRVFERSQAALGRLPPQIPNELSAEEVPYQLLLEMHRATILPDPPLSSALPANAMAAGDSATRFARWREPAPDAPLATMVRRRRSALDFDTHTAHMERGELEQLLDFATRDWPADCRFNFNGGDVSAVAGSDFVTLYLYVHRVRDCQPGVYRWNTAEGTLQQLHCGNVERIAAFLSLEQPLAGNSCFTVSMIADLAGAAQAFGNRGYRYVYFEAGAIGQRFYLGAEALGWNATGIGAFYDDDVHRYLGFLEDRENSVSASANAAEKSSFIMTGSPASRHAAAPTGKMENELNQVANHPPADPSTLPQQVIYHFAVGRAILDPRIEG